MNRYQITARLKEPSTWAGLSALGVLFGVPLGTMDALAQVGITVAAAAAVLLPEKAAPIEDRGIQAQGRDRPLRRKPRG